LCGISDLFIAAAPTPGMAKQPHILVEPGAIHDCVLLPGDPDRVDRIAGHCEDATTLTHNREYKLVNATYAGVDLSICSTGVGSPSAAVAVEELAAVGVETFLRVGTCGGLQESVAIGDLIVATGASKDEGTTRRYEADTVPAIADHDVVGAVLAAAADHDDAATPTVHRGPVATDDAFYAETEAYVRDWEAAGLLAVEMEAAAIFALARRKGLRAGAICTADGNLVTGTQKGTTDDEELPAAAKNNVGRAIEIALDAATRLDG
jgi:uridine phosphorylase